MSVKNTFDISLNNDEGYFDISIDDDGDILTDDSFVTAILMTIYCEKRALPSEVPEASRRRGWIGNESTPGFEIGSKLWTYYQERLTVTTLEEMAAQLERDSQWFIDEGLLESVSANAVFNAAEVGVELSFRRHQSETETRYFKLWDRTN